LTNPANWQWCFQRYMVYIRKEKKKVHRIEYAYLVERASGTRARELRRSRS
jgi:hypothetical protein